MNLKKNVLVAILGVLILPTLAAAKPRGDRHTVVAAKTHPFAKFLFGR